MAVNVIPQFRERATNLATSVAHSAGIGTKEFKVLTQHHGTEGGGSFITTEVRQELTTQGTVTNTNNRTDLALQGRGLMPVQDKNGNVVYTRRGDFRVDKLGDLVNGAGLALLALPKSEDGQTQSLLSALERVNFANIKGEPRATTSIAISMNLDARKDALRGAGPEFSMKRSGRNSSTGITKPDELILPEQLGRGVSTQGTGSISVGDVFTLTSTPPGRPKSITYGAITTGISPSAETPVFGAQNTTDSFSFGVNPGQITAESQLSIIVGGVEKVFTAVQGNADTSKNRLQFNSMQTLSDAINNSGSLFARIDPTTGVLYIGPKKAEDGVTFANRNGGTFVELLGLTDIASADPGTRFNSLTTFKNAVNENNSNFQLEATILNGDIKITSKKATSDFNIEVNSVGKQAISKAQVLASSEKTRATVFITAPNSGLVAGDYVKLEGMNSSQLPNGIYYVTGVTTNGYTVSMMSNNPNAAPGINGSEGLGDSFVAAGNDRVLNVTSTASWTRTNGISEDTQQGDVEAGVDGAVGAGTARINIVLGAMGSIVQNDIVYISGSQSNGIYTDNANKSVTLPDGYYRVLATPAANTITVEPTLVDAVAPAPGTSNKLNVTKIGNGDVTGFGAAGTSFNSVAFETIGAGDTFIRVNLPNNNYNIGDYIRFSDLPDAYTIDGMAIANNFDYKVVGESQDYIDVEIIDSDGNTIAATAGGVSANYVTYAGADPTDVGNNFKVDNFSRVLEYFNLQQEKKTYDKQYDPSNPLKSLSSGNLPAKDIFTQTLTAYDSLGDKYNLLIHFAKLNKNLFTVEISAIVNEDGTYDYSSARADGQLLGGTISFDTDGNLQNIVGIDKAIQIQRNNGSSPTNLSIDWTNELANIDKGTVTQFASGDGFEFVQQNGQAPGTVSTFEVESNGDIVITYNNGSTDITYSIPVVDLPNINGLIYLENDSFSASKDSGDPILKTAGVGGAGKYVGGALENSTIDSTTTLLDLNQAANDVQALARAHSTNQNIIKTVLDETR